MLNLIKTCGLVGALGLSVSIHAQTVGFATLSPGSILHAQASVIAKVVQEMGDTGLDVKIHTDAPH